MSAVRVFLTGESIPGTQYVVIERLGAGGFGTVYKVRHRILATRKSCVKILNFDARDRPDLAEKLHREALMLATMNHRNIVSVYDAGITTETLPRAFFVMEYLPGATLRDTLIAAPRGFGAATSVSLAIELADGLDYAHTMHGVIHRDIKPDNIYVQAAPNHQTIPKLLDFGVMHLLAIDAPTEEFVGTLRYAAPEQILGKAPTPQTDLYAFGLVLYEMLTGHVPWPDARSTSEVTDAHLTRAPEFGARRESNDLTDLILSLLAKDPSARPASANAVALRLRRILRDLRNQLPAISDANITEETPLENRLVTTRAEGMTTAPPAPPELVKLASKDTVEFEFAPPIEGPPPEAAPPALLSTLPSPGTPHTSQRRTVEGTHPDVQITPSIGDAHALRIFREAVTHTQRTPIPWPAVTEEIPRSDLPKPPDSDTRFVDVESDESRRAPRPAAGLAGGAATTPAPLARPVAPRPDGKRPRWSWATSFALVVVVGAWGSVVALVRSGASAESAPRVAGAGSAPSVLVVAAPAEGARDAGAAPSKAARASALQ